MNITAKGTVILEDGSEYGVEVEGYQRVDETYDQPLKEMVVERFQITPYKHLKHDDADKVWHDAEDQLKAILQAEYDKERVMKCYTDYPLIGLGDVEYKEAPIREVEFVSYDGDKYVTVLYDGIEYEFKSGYLYKTPGRGDDGECFTFKELAEMNEAE